MANTHSTLTELLVDIANAIREKKNSTEIIVADTFPTEIENLKTGFDYVNSDITTIPEYAFYGCEDLKSVDCYNVESIGANAFENCKGLKSVILYDGVINIGENTFNGCDCTIYCMFDSQPDGWGDNWNPDNCEVVWVGAPIETWDISATENDNVIAKLYNDIYNEGYYELTISGSGSIKKESYGLNGTAWGSYKSKIKSATIYNGVVDCVDFRGHTSLTSIAIPDSITSIDRYVFQNCTSLTSVTIPNSVTSIGGDAFKGCTSLKSVYITDLEAWYSINFEWSTSNPLNNGSSLYLNGQLVTDLVIPDSVTSIGRNAFYGYTSLTSIAIPDSVTSIGYSAFYGCTSLTSIVIPNSVISISNYAFYNCTSLTSVTIGNSVTSMDYGAFYGCTSLKSVYITDLEAWCNIGFSGDSNPCYNGASLYLNGQLVTDLVIPDSVTSIGYSAFYGCTSLTSIVIPNSVISIDNYAFSSCLKLTSINIPDSVTSIGDKALFNTHCTYINYTGTVAQWNAITFGTDWDAYTSTYTIHCTDGDIAKNGTITYH